MLVLVYWSGRSGTEISIRTAAKQVGHAGRTRTRERTDNCISSLNDASFLYVHGTFITTPHLCIVRAQIELAKG